MINDKAYIGLCHQRKVKSNVNNVNSMLHSNILNVNYTLFTFPQRLLTYYNRLRDTLILTFLKKVKQQFYKHTFSLLLYSTAFFLQIDFLTAKTYLNALLQSIKVFHIKIHIEMITMKSLAH